MSRKDEDDFVAFLFLAAALSFFLLPFAGTGSHESDGFKWYKVILPTITVALISLAVVAWCLHWHLWLAIVLTVFASIFAAGRLLSLIF